MAFIASSIALAKLLNAHQIRWAYGGSSLLYYLDIPVMPRDLDVIVALEDVEKAKWILLEQGAAFIEEKKSDDVFLTKVFYTFHWQDIEVDFMASPGISKSGESFYIPFDAEGPWHELHLEDTTVYLSSPLDWLKYYGMMSGRETRVLQLETYLEMNPQKKTSR